MIGRLRHAERIYRLTDRQREVLHLIAQGRSNSWIARHLHVSEKNIVQHASRIYDALGLPGDDEDTNRRVLAVLTYLDAPAHAFTSAHPAAVNE